jgi:hypothetical protein
MQKNTIIITGVGLVAFALGWLCHPSAEPVTPAPGNAAESAAKATKHGDRSETKLVLDPRKKGPQNKTKEEREQDRKMVLQSMERDQELTRVMRIAQSGNMDRMVEALGLSQDQREAYEALLVGRREALTDAVNQKKSGAEQLKAAAEAEQQFNEEIKKVLDQEQYDAYQALQERKRSNSVEASAQNQCADLINMVPDMDDKQRQQTLEIMRGLSTQVDQSQPAGWSLMKERYNIFGSEKSALIDQMGLVMDDPEVSADPLFFQRKMVQQMRQDISNKISSLSSVLTPAQLSQYRKGMEARLTLFDDVPTPTSLQKK